MAARIGRAWRRAAVWPWSAVWTWAWGGGGIVVTPISQLLNEDGTVFEMEDGSPMLTE